MIYELRIDKCLGELFTGKKNGSLWAEGNIKLSELPSCIRILHKEDQLITSSFYLGILERFQDAFEFEDLSGYTLSKITSLIIVDSTNSDELKRAFNRL